MMSERVETRTYDHTRSPDQNRTLALEDNLALAIDARDQWKRRAEELEAALATCQAEVAGVTAEIRMAQLRAIDAIDHGADQREALKFIVTALERVQMTSHAGRDFRERCRKLEADLQEARELLEEATGYARGIEGEDGAGLPTTESLLGRILIFLQRTEGGRVG